MVTGAARDLLLLLAAAVVLPLVLVVVRRYLLERGHGIEMAVRTRMHAAPGSGWAFGVARYSPDSLEWFRTFSLSARPRWRFRRPSFEVLARRALLPAESAVLRPGHVVISCRADGTEVDLAMSDSALTGLLAWTESAPPGRDLVA